MVHKKKKKVINLSSSKISTLFIIMHFLKPLDINEKLLKYRLKVTIVKELLSV